MTVSPTANLVLHHRPREPGPTRADPPAEDPLGTQLPRLPAAAAAAAAAAAGRRRNHPSGPSGAASRGWAVRRKHRAALGVHPKDRTLTASR